METKIISKEGSITMQQPQYKSNFEIKFLARMHTGQHLGILISATLIKFIITIFAINLVSVFVPSGTTIGYFINYILVFFVQIATSILSVGTAFIFLKSACSMPSAINDLFCGFRQNTMKILKISAVIAIIESICMIPLDIASLQYSEMINSIPLFQNNGTSLNFLLSGSTIDNHEFLEAYNVFYSASMKYYSIMLICTVISTILTLPFFPVFYMVLDFPDWSVTTILKKSFEVMSGNKLRLFLLYVSFIPSFLLSIFTCGIPLIWVIPYMSMAETDFYLDMMSVRNKSVNSIS